MAKDYYSVLGIGKSAGIDEIKRAYRELAMRYHPDKNKGKDAEIKMQELNEAYAVLSDPEKRRQYDTFGSEGFRQRYTEEDIFRNFNFEDIMREFQENIFSGGGFGPFATDFQEPEQTGVNLYISFDEIEKGFEREYEVQRNMVCENCKGSGGDPDSKQVKCATCNGTGRRHVQQNTMFGRFSMVATCDKCRGRGRIFERSCKTCHGNGRINVKEKFRIKVEKEEKEGKEKGRGRFFGVF
jgi:molecular chaperone DnaJ